jgi:hypothetical protein
MVKFSQNKPAGRIRSGGRFHGFESRRQILSKGKSPHASLAHMKTAAQIITTGLHHTMTRFLA